MATTLGKPHSRLSCMLGASVFMLQSESRPPGEYERLGVI